LSDKTPAGRRRPPAVLLVLGGIGLAVFVVPLTGLVLVLVPSTLAATFAWSAVRVAMRSPAELIVGTLAVLLFVSLWIVGLLLIAVTAAWRAAVWSVAHRSLWPRPAHPTTLGPG